MRFQTFILGRAHRHIGELGAVYQYDDEDKVFKPWRKDWNACDLGVDSEGYPVTHNDWGEYRLSGLMIGMDGDRPIAEKPPFSTDDYLSLLWDTDGRAEKEGLLHFFPSVEVVTIASLEQCMASWDIEFIDIEATRKEIIDVVVCALDALKDRELTGAELERWQESPTCPACDGGELEALPDSGRSGGLIFTDYECLGCGAKVSHVHNKRLDW